MKNKTLLIDRESFCDWFFDQDIIEDFVSNYEVIQELIKTGKFTITANELISGAGYLPIHVAAEGQELILDEMDEIDMSSYDIIKFAKK